jgi:hypothetical protein
MEKAKGLSGIAKGKTQWVVVIATILLQVVFLLPGVLKNGIGFPLDDAWIHQTYGRNLVQQGSWSFIPGVVSGGSTSPLWTLLLAPGFFFGGNFFFYWTLIISCAAFCGLIFFLCKTLQNIVGGEKRLLILGLGLLAALEWHLQWAAASGMETILYSLGIVLFVYLITKSKVNWTQVGMVLGLLVWVRPDGLTLLGPLVFVILQSIISKKLTWKNIVQFLIPFIIFIGSYLVFNYLTTGNLFPNTFFAKQMEYSELLAVPLWQRILNEFSPIGVGVCLFLVPGVIYSFAKAAKTKNMAHLGAMLWAIGYVVLYAIRLPVIYQHGRYVIPVIPIVLLYGVAGWAGLLALIKAEKSREFASFGVSVTLIAISLAFFFKGADSYLTDVKTIDTFMVQPAKWISQHTDKSALIAVHDIGAMGFYGERRLIDLAGLVNPEVIPFIRDERKIGEYIHDRGAGYFVGFSDWYATSESWGEEIITFNMIVDEKVEEVVIIKLNH